MKRLILTVAILAGGMSTFAMPNPVVSPEAIHVVVNDEFKEIAIDKLPAAVSSAVKNDFSTATISKAYVNSSEQYKLELSLNGSKSTVYADKEGNWLEESAIKSQAHKQSTISE